MPSRRFVRIALVLTALAGAARADDDAAPDGFVRLGDVAPEIVVDMRYNTALNFVGERLAGYEANQCWLLEPVAEALGRAAARLGERGYGLIVFDCYRPARAVRRFMDWLDDPAPGAMRRMFHPDLDKAGVRAGQYISPRSRHSRGVAVDLALIRPGFAPLETARADPAIACDAPFEQRFRDTDVDMGTGYDCFSEKSHTASPEVGPAARANRRVLVDAMMAEGFANYRREWWHFEFPTEQDRGVHYDFPVR